MDPIAQFKENAKVGWSSFAPTEIFTGLSAPTLVRVAKIGAGKKVLDVGCGTGVVALSAARIGARVTGIDLTPKLVERARENSALTKLDVEWHEGDAEALPFGDGSFDVVVSQFGHMFAPRPEVAIREMLRVLKSGGTIAFSTWPPDLYVGRLFALVGRYSPPPPPGVSPPVQWGDPKIVRERLGDGVKDVYFTMGTMELPCLSPQHQRVFAEGNIGPVQRLVQNLEANDKAKLATFRQELDDLTALFYEDNRLRQDYLVTRATKL